MKKTLGLTAMTAGLIAAGCAVMPHAVKAPSGVSGPVTLTLTGINTGDRSTQLIRSTAKSAVIVVYNAKGQYGPVSTSGGLCAKGNEVATDPISGDLLIATASVTSATTTMTLPKIPSGGHVIKVFIYSTPATAAGFASLVDFGTLTGTPIVAGSEFYTVGEAEAYVAPIVGVPLSATLPVYTTIPYAGILKSSAVNASTSVSFSGVSPSTTGNFYLRMPKWNPLSMLATASKTGLAVRVSITSSTAWTDAKITALASGGASFSIGSIEHTNGFSPAVPLNWYWTTDKKTCYADVYPGNASSSFGAINGFAALNGAAEDDASSSLSLQFKPDLLPSGYTMYFMDAYQGTSLPGNGTF